MNVFKYWGRAWFDETQQQEFKVDLCRVAGSNISENDAKHLAGQRLSQSIERLKAGNALQEYDYDSKTLTEELIEEIFGPNGELVAAITRNRYGALVLNTQKILFADIDAECRSETLFERCLAWLGKRVLIKNKSYHLQQIERFSADNLDLELIVYETFAGFRVVIANHEFESLDPKAQTILSELGSDPLYVKLCQLQDCFRARLTPKPWRCGSSKPNVGFPFAGEEQAQLMVQWQKQYDEKLHKYKVCNKNNVINKQSSSELSDSRQLIARILRVHDAYVLGDTDLPLA